MLSQQDVGAMRFPYIPPQKHTFDLFDYLGIHNKLIPYFMENKNNDILYFNGKPMTVAQYKASQVADPFATKSNIDPKIAASMRKAALYPFKERLKKDFDDGWKYLMTKDKHSMRTYLSFEQEIPEPVCVA